MLRDPFPTCVQFRYAVNPETRRRAWEGYETRVPANVPIFEKVLEIRRKCADLLGYKTWADYITEVKMVGSAKGVVDVSVLPLYPARFQLIAIQVPR